LHPDTFVGTTAPSRSQRFSLRPGYTHALACIAVRVEHHRLSAFWGPNSPENFADKVVSLRRRYAFSDEVRVIDRRNID
jgi:hypothetical protein